MRQAERTTAKNVTADAERHVLNHSKNDSLSREYDATEPQTPTLQTKRIEDMETAESACISDQVQRVA
jgi:hypothetical protein